MQHLRKRMLIVTNGLTSQSDEGFLNVANNLIKRLKREDSKICIATYERQSELTDRHFHLNKLMIHPGFLKLVSNFSTVIYIPFPARTFPTALRIFILSRFAKEELKVILVMKSDWNWSSKILFKISKAKLIVLSKDAYEFYKTILGQERITYLKTGVDTKKFHPVSKEEQAVLKEKYGFDSKRPILLHVGHLKEGRNVRELLKVDEKYQVILVTSTLTMREEDKKLKEELQIRPNVHLLRGYIPNIEEIYQMSDLYFFPTNQSGNCIDVPLSCLEAASCNKPVLTTDYGEMKILLSKQGFYPYQTMKETELNNYIEKILKEKEGNIRDEVLSYDWEIAVEQLKKS